MIDRSVFSGVTALAALALAAPASAQVSDRTLAEYEAECEAGTLASCHEAGRAYMLGNEHPANVEADDARAIATAATTLPAWESGRRRTRLCAPGSSRCLRRAASWNRP